MNRRLAPNRPAFRHDALLARIFEQVESGSEELRLVLHEIHHLKRLGVEITLPIVDRMVAEVRRQIRAQSIVPAPQPRPVSSRFASFKHDGPVVYYVRIGNRVKIGTSVNLPDRLSTINPEEVLAVEPGDIRTERRRHREFANLRTHGEWFRYEEPLTQHIEQIRR